MDMHRIFHCPGLKFGGNDVDGTHFRGLVPDFTFVQGAAGTEI
jgi:hypothetical protein